MDHILYWNEVATEADRRTHTTLAPREVGVQGPAGSSRALAMVRLAMPDAYFSINPKPHGTYPDADPSWLPLGAPKTNNVGQKNFTPRFPAYPSGHATFGAAVNGLWQMIEENARSRIFLGVHWVFDAFAVTPSACHRSTYLQTCTEE